MSQSCRAWLHMNKVSSKHDEWQVLFIVSHFYYEPRTKFVVCKNNNELTKFFNQFHCELDILSVDIKHFRNLTFIKLTDLDNYSCGHHSLH